MWAHQRVTKNKNKLLEEVKNTGEKNYVESQEQSGNLEILESGKIEESSNEEILGNCSKKADNSEFAIFCISCLYCLYGSQLNLTLRKTLVNHMKILHSLSVHAFIP